MINKIIISIMFGFFMSGCISAIQNQVNMQNKTLKNDQMPIRLYKVKSTKKADFYESNWAGEKGRSITLNSQVVYNDVLKGIKQACGFEANDLVETRIVSHENPVFYEVWVFKDQLSKREDKTSALSVILTQVPNSGGVDIAIKGRCHSDRSKQYIFGK